MAKSKKNKKVRQDGPQHVVLISHVPYGFFEKEMHGYFSQFGDVKRVRIVRNKNGNHTGVAFVEFKDAEVAQIAAQTMNNYLLAENRLRCRVVKPDRVPKLIRQGGLFGKIVKPGMNRFLHAKDNFKPKTPEQEKKQLERFVAELREKMLKIEHLGINYKFDFEEKLTKFMASQQKEENKMEMDKEDESKGVEKVKMGKKEELLEIESDRNESTPRIKTR